MHSTDYLKSEVVEKLKIAKLMKVQLQEQQLDLKKTLGSIRSSVDKSIAYHVESLKIRASWLKSHAEDIYKLKEEKAASDLQMIETSIQKLTNSLTDTDSVNDNGNVREILKNTLNEVDLTDATDYIESGTLVFAADNEQLKNAIITFGNITLKDEVKSLCSELEDFVIADVSDDDIEILSDKFCMKKEKASEMTLHSELSPNMWLRSNTIQNDQPEQMEDKSDTQLAEKISEWLRNLNETSSSSESSIEDLNQTGDTKWLVQQEPRSYEGSESDTESFLSNIIAKDLSEFLYKPSEKSTEPIDKDVEILHEDNLSFLREGANNQSYTYPKSLFLDHFDFLKGQENSKFLANKPKTTTKLDKEDEKCKWLFREKDCTQSSCSSSKGCQMFDANWLRTASDW